MCHPNRCGPALREAPARLFRYVAEITPQPKARLLQQAEVPVLAFRTGDHVAQSHGVEGVGQEVDAAVDEDGVAAGLVERERLVVHADIVVRPQHRLPPASVPPGPPIG